jgi:hypothetical protein
MEQLTLGDYFTIAESHGIAITSQMTGVLDARVKANMAADAAQPGLITTANGGIPAMLATFIDPDLIRIVVTPNKAAQIYGEVRKGDFALRLAMFPAVEMTGEVSSYGDYANNGSAGFNTMWPQRENYLYQNIIQVGELETMTSAMAKIDAIAEKYRASQMVMSKFENQMYFYGIAGIQNYGALNSPDLLPSITPGYKAALAANGGWVVGGNVIATPTEIQKDIQALFLQLVNQTAGLIDAQTPMKLVCSPQTAVALLATNEIFATNVMAMVKVNFPNMTIDTATQYATDAGQLAQLIVEKFEGQDVGYCAFSEKLRAGAVIPELSSIKQKRSAGGFGYVLRFPVGIASMLGL